MLPSPRQALLAALLLPLAACAEPGDAPTATAASSGPPTPGMTAAAITRPPNPAPPHSRTAQPAPSRTFPPTVRAVPRPPKATDPADLRATDTISGHVTRGGRGPCYGLVAEDGVEYALHGPGYGTLVEGSFVTLRIVSRPSEVDCGPGVPTSIVTR